MDSIRSADGTRIAYQRTGDGPVLVLIHGTADDHTLWTQLLPALSERFTVIALDRRGHGESGATDTATYVIDREFEDVVAVVDAAGEPAVLLGHSYGALCALEAARLTPNVRGLVLYEPPIPIPPGSAISPPGTLAKMESMLAAGDQEGVLLTFAREIARVPEEAIDAARAQPGWQAGVDSAYTIGYEVRSVESYVFDPERFRDLATPSLLLMGGESPPFLKAATKTVAAGLPNSRLAVLEGQGHRAMDTAPDTLVREIVQFFAEEPDAVKKTAMPMSATAGAASR